MINVLFIVGKYYEGFEKEFGGTTREYHAISNAFKTDETIELDTHINENIEKTIDLMDDYDVVHVDDNKTIEELLSRGIIPDVIGPTARSPAKNEQAKANWESRGLSVDDYYKAIVVRSNNSEERIGEYWDNIKYINLGVDTDEIPMNDESTKKWILWAGDVTRVAKNFQMFMDIMKVTDIPKGYEWKVLSSYKLSDYLDILRHTALVVNTSLNETFCFAMFEANSMGVPTIYKKNLHNPKGHKQKLKFHKEKNIQVDYRPEAYRDIILELLKNKRKMKLAQKDARKYAEDVGSYENIRESFGKIYIEACEKKYGKECFSYG